MISQENSGRPIDLDKIQEPTKEDRAVNTRPQLEVEQPIEEYNKFPHPPHRSNRDRHPLELYGFHIT